MPRCQRCGKETNITIMSRFNTQEICMPCEDVETKHPDYDKARQAELDQVRMGNYNYDGIGLPSNYSEHVKKIKGE